MGVRDVGGVQNVSELSSLECSLHSCLTTTVSQMVGTAGNRRGTVTDIVAELVSSCSLCMDIELKAKFKLIATI